MLVKRTTFLLVLNFAGIFSGESFVPVDLFKQGEEETTNLNMVRPRKLSGKSSPGPVHPLPLFWSTSLGLSFGLKLTNCQHLSQSTN